MDIVTLDQVREGDTIEIPIDGKDKAVKVEYNRARGSRCEVGVKVGLLSYAWDHEADTEVFVLARGAK